jgi:hypothetical protein
MKAIAVKRKMNMRIKIMINSNINEEISSFNNLGYKITVTNNRDLEIEMKTFNQMCSTMRKLNKMRCTDGIL